MPQNLPNLPESAIPLTPPPAPRADNIFFGPDGLRAGWSLLLFLIIVRILIVASLPIFGHLQAHHPAAPDAAHTATEHPISAVLAQDGGLFLVLLLSSFAMSRIERRPLRSYGIGATRAALPQFLTGTVWGLLLLSVLVLILSLTHLLVFDHELLTSAAALRFGAEWAFGFLCVALFEEYFLRGFLLFTLARGLSGIYSALLESPHHDALGFWTAATLLAFLFGLGHRANPGESPLGLLTAGLAALVFSFSLWRTGSLWWAIGFHAVWDWAQSFLYGVADSGITMQHHLFATHPAGPTLLSGGLTGPEGSAFVLPVLLLAVAIIWLTLPQAPRPSTILYPD